MTSSNVGHGTEAVANLEVLIVAERKTLARLGARADAAARAASAATPGGLRDYDPAILSGLTRSWRHAGASRRQRFAAYDREAVAAKELSDQERRVANLERRLEAVKRDAASPRDLDAVGKGWLIRDRHGWHRVVRVNAKTFSVETAYSWTDRIDRSRVIETRAPKEAAHAT